MHLPRHWSWCDVVSFSQADTEADYTSWLQMTQHLLLLPDAVAALFHARREHGTGAAKLLDLNINTANAWASYTQHDWTTYLAARTIKISDRTPDPSGQTVFAVWPGTGRALVRVQVCVPARVVGARVPDGPAR